jgi:hypothetical protein
MTGSVIRFWRSKRRLLCFEQRSHVPGPCLSCRTDLLRTQQSAARNEDGQVSMLTSPVGHGGKRERLAFVLDGFLHGVVTR